MKTLTIISLVFLLSISFLNAQVNPDDNYWSSDFAIPSTDEVRTILVDGDFYYYNEFGRLVRWNINSLEYEILGMSAAGTIYCITKHDNYIYVGGNFERMNGTAASFIARWKDGVWDTVATGLNGRVNAICFDDNDEMWIGGQFTTINGFESNYIARRKSNHWEPVTGFNSQVRSIVSNGSDVFVGGDFNFYDSTMSDYSLVAKFDGMKWSNAGSLASNSGGKVFSMSATVEGYIVAGGIFENNGADSISPNIAYFDGSNWNGLGAGLDGMVLAVEARGDKFYAGGYFNSSGGRECKSIAVFEGNDWSELGGGISGGDYPSVICIQETTQGLFVGGNFSKAGSIDCLNTALFSNASWQNFLPDKRNGTISSVGSFTIDKTNNMLYAGGGFVKTGKVVSYGISKFDGNEWFGCNEGLTPTSNSVYSMQAVGDTIYFTGWFDYADGIQLRNVAKWIDDNKTWEPIGEGIKGGDFDLGPLLVTEDRIYVSGNFKYLLNGPDTTFANYITYWDGTKWNPLNGGLGRKNNQRVFVEKMIESPDGHVIVVGTFDFAGSNDLALNYAEWDPDSLVWKSDTKYFSNSVYTIFYDEPWYYFGGTFDSAGVLIDVNGLVRQNAVTGEWQKCNNGVDGYVNAITKWGDDIYIAGRFRTASGSTCNSVARYNPDDNKIYPLGSGINYGVNYGNTPGLAAVSDLIVYKNELYFAGMFTSVGGKKSSSNIAKWTKAPVNVKEKIINGHEIIISLNPVSDYIEINVPRWRGQGVDNSASIHIFDILGIEILQGMDSRFRGNDNAVSEGVVRLDVSGLTPGVYFVRVGDVVRKFVKM